MTRSWISKLALCLGFIPLTVGAFQTKLPLPEPDKAPAEEGAALYDQRFMDVFNHLLDFQPQSALDQLDAVSLPTNWDRLLRGWAFHQQGRYARALEFLQQVDPEADSLDGYLAYRHEELIRADEALQHFEVVDTDHFSIRYQTGKDEVLVYFLPDVLESAYAELGRIFSWQADRPIIVEIMPDHELFSQASALQRSQIETTGTIALCVENRLAVLTPRRVALGYDWPDTVSHELVHYVLNKIGGAKVPLWLHEGIAKSFENRWHEHAIPPLDELLQTRLAEALEKQDFVTFAEMLPSFAALPTAQRAQLAYAQVASMVHFLVESHGQSVLGQMVRAYATEDQDRVFEDFVHQDLATFRSQWTAWAKAQGYQIRTVDAPNGVTLLDEDQRDDALAAGPPSQDVTKKHVRLGDLLLERYRYFPALREYQKAQAQTDQVSRQLQLRFLTCYDHLGYAREMLDFIDAHATHIERDATMLTYKAQAQLGLKQYAAAGELLERALHINPFYPKIHAQRKALFEQMGQPDEAQRAAHMLEILSGTPPETVPPEQES